MGGGGNVPFYFQPPTFYFAAPPLPPSFSGRCTLIYLVSECVYHSVVAMDMLWFNFILGLNFIFFCFKLIIIHYHTPKQKKIKFKPRIKLNHNRYIAFLSYVAGTTMMLWDNYFQQFENSVKEVTLHQCVYFQQRYRQLENNIAHKP